MRRVAFLDRDGVINFDHGYVYRIEDFQFIPGVLEGLKTLQAHGFDLVIFTNQSGIGRGYYTESQLQTLHQWLLERLAHEGIHVLKIYYCPHHPQAKLDAYRQSCHCRKPAPGMLLQAQQELDIDLKASIVFGDKISDCEAGQKAGCTYRVLLATNGQAPLPRLTSPATHVAHSLMDAVRAPWFKALMPSRIQGQRPSFENKICTLADLQSRAQKLPKPVVFTNGVFDILHRGHVTYLAQAKALGQSLIVAINSDASVKTLGKGEDRPINTEEDRAALIAALESTDLVVIFSESVPLEPLRLSKADIYVKGGDYDIHTLPETQLIQSWGGQAKAINFDFDRSTTQLLKKVRSDT